MYNDITNFQAILILLSNLNDKRPLNLEDSQKEESYKRLILYGFPYSAFSFDSIKSDLNSVKKYENSTIAIDLNKNLKDPVRNYFETILGYHNVKNLFNDGFFSNKLDKFFQAFEDFKDKLKKENENNFAEILRETNSKKEGKDKTIIHSKAKFSQDEQKKIDKLLDFVWFALQYEKSRDFICRRILNCYGKNEFAESYRSKKSMFSDEKQSKEFSFSNKTGLVRSKDPTPYFDKYSEGFIDDNGNRVLIDNLGSISDRCPDLYAPIIEDNTFPKVIADSGVHIFSNSLSGTTLAILRLYAATLTKEKLFSIDDIATYKSQDSYSILKDYENDFKNNDFFIKFFRLITSLLLYLEGGHTMIEFYKVLEISAVRSILNELVNNFSLINIEEIYYKNSETSFNLSLRESIDYMKTYLNRNRFLSELKENDKFKKSYNDNEIKSLLERNSLLSSKEFKNICDKMKLSHIDKVANELNIINKSLDDYKMIPLYHADTKIQILNNIKMNLQKLLENLMKDQPLLLKRRFRLKIMLKYSDGLLQLLYSVYSEENSIRNAIYLSK